MKKIKNLVSVILIVSMLLISLAGCAGVDNTVLMSYKGNDLYSSIFALQLSQMKAEYDSILPQYGYTWDTILSGDKTIAEDIFESFIDQMKRSLIIDTLCNEYDLKLTDEEKIQQIEDYLDNTISTAGNKYEIELTLSEYGVDLDMYSKFLYTSFNYEMLYEYLYGANGTQKLPESDAKEIFEADYFNIEYILFPFHDSSNVLKTREAANDAAAVKTFFEENFVKVRHILIQSVDSNRQPLADDVVAQKKAEAEKLFEDLMASDDKSKFFADNYSKSEDPGATEYPEGYVLSKYSGYVPEFIDGAFSIEVGEFTIVESDFGWHIMSRGALDMDEDYDDAMKTEAKTDMIKDIINSEAEEFYEGIKDGSNKFEKGSEDVDYTYTEGKAYKAGELDYTLETQILKLEVSENAICMVMSTGVYIIKKNALTDDDFDAVKDTILDELSQEAIYNYLNSFINDITVNSDELSKFDIKTAKEFLLG